MAPLEYSDLNSNKVFRLCLLQLNSFNFADGLLVGMSMLDIKRIVEGRKSLIWTTYLRETLWVLLLCADRRYVSNDFL